MKKEQIYHQVYQNLEKEVLELTSAIHFVDKQLSVFSIKIADLITRCVIEIESITKEIYRLETNEEPSTAGTAIIWLDDNWSISRKRIRIKSPYFHFSDVKLEFEPFNYNKGSKEDYYSAYNAIKHDRNKNIEKANLLTLIRALGALFILNIYFKNDRILFENDISVKKVEKLSDSKIFNFYVAPYEDFLIPTSFKEIDRKICIYRIIKVEHNYGLTIYYIRNNDEEGKVVITNAGNVFQKYAKENFRKKIKIEDCNNFLSRLMYNFARNFIEEFKNKNDIKEITSIISKKMQPAYFAELVKE